MYGSSWAAWDGVGGSSLEPRESSLPHSDEIAV